MRLELANGSRFIALPGTEGTIRGYSGAKTGIVDEASRVDNALFAAVCPMLATTRLVLRSVGTQRWVGPDDGHGARLPAH